MRCALLPIAVVLASCGSGGALPAGDGAAGDKAPGEDASPVSLDDFCVEYHHALCTREKGCTRYGAVPTSFDDCDAYAASMKPACEADLVALVRADLVAYSPDGMGRCLGRVGAVPCAEVFLVPGDRPACLRDGFVGAAANGEFCRDDVACEGILVCDLSASCPGKCVAPGRPVPVAQGIGEQCGADGPFCRFGLQCRGAGEGTPGACAAWRTLGQSCGSDSGDCREFYVWCDMEPGADEGVCVEPPGPGEECSDAKGLSSYCVGAVCDAAIGFCRAPVAQDGRCTEDTVCLSGNCGVTQRCEPPFVPEDPCPPT